MKDSDNEIVQLEVPPTVSSNVSKRIEAGVINSASSSFCSSYSSDDEAAVAGNNNSSPSLSSSVQVAVRVRPLLGFEADDTCMEIDSEHNSSNNDNNNNSNKKDTSNVIRMGSGKKAVTFTFDEVFPVSTLQHEVFDRRVRPLVMSCLEGYNATILAYGQTGSGKTFTIMGPSAAAVTTTTTMEQDDEESSGVIPRAIKMIFSELANMASSVSTDNDHHHQGESSSSPPPPSPLPPDSQEHMKVHENDNNDENDQSEKNDKDDKDHPVFEYEVRVQFLELYGEDLRDLLKPMQPVSEVVETPVVGDNSNNKKGDNKKLVEQKVTIRNSAGGTNNEPEVIGAVHIKVNNAHEAMECLTNGMLRRVTAATAMNETSSRSHAIFSVLVDQQYTSSSTTATTPATKKRSKFHFVDLAGSERIKRTHAEGQRLKEGIDINKGLLVLGNVISALGDAKKRGKTFVPYRDSKLTRLLQGSLGGNHKTLMIACVSPCSANMEESLSCLRYANRAKNIQNHAVINTMDDGSSKIIADLKQQIQALCKDWLLYNQGGDVNQLVFTKRQIEGMKAGALVADVPILKSHSKSTIKSNNSNGNYQPTEVAVVSPENITMHNERGDDNENSQTMATTTTTKAEKEWDRMQQEVVGNSGDTEEMQKLFLERFAQYEAQISQLREELNETRLELRRNNNNIDEENPQESSNGRGTKQKQGLFSRTTADSPPEQELNEEDANNEMLAESSARQQELLMQKEHEILKWRRMYDDKASECQRLQHIAMGQMDQIEQLEVQIVQLEEEAEKKLLSSMPDGDGQVLPDQSVAVTSNTSADSLVTNSPGFGTLSPPPLPPPPSLSKATLKEEDVSKLCDYFNQKVVEVSRKEEVVADKLAKCWEEHFDLLQKRRNVKQQESQQQQTDSNEERVGQQQQQEQVLQSIDAQINYKEDRIRQLARRLEKISKDEVDPSVSELCTSSSGDTTDTDSKENMLGEEGSFLLGDELEKVCKGVPSIAASRMANKVLFGMVIQRGRRIGTLARSASCLDETLRNAQQKYTEQEASYRSYMDDQRNQVMQLEKMHKERVISLMSLVTDAVEKANEAVGKANEVVLIENTDNDGSQVMTTTTTITTTTSNDVADNGGQNNNNTTGTTNVLKMEYELAKDRIADLERQLCELQKARQDVVVAN